MKRRGFLQTLAGLVAVPAVPAAGGAVMRPSTGRYVKYGPGFTPQIQDGTNVVYGRGAWCYPATKDDGLDEVIRQIRAMTVDRAKVFGLPRGA